MKMIEKMAERVMGDTQKELGEVLKNILENLEQQTKTLQNIEVMLNERLKNEEPDGIDNPAI